MKESLADKLIPGNWENKQLHLLLDDTLFRYMHSWTRLRRFKSLDSPTVIVNTEKEYFESLEQRVTLICQKLKMSPEKTLADYVGKTITETEQAPVPKEEDRNTSTLEAKDLPDLTLFYYHLKGEQYHLSREIYKETVWLDKLMANRKEAYSHAFHHVLISYYARELHWEKTNKWIDILHPRGKTTPELVAVPLIPGRNYSVSLSPKNASTFPYANKVDRLQTFPITNALFNYEHKPKGEFSLPDNSKAIVSKAGSIDYNRELTHKLFPEFMGNELDNGTKLILTSIVRNKLHVDTKAILNTNIFAILGKIAKFISRPDTEEQGLDNPMDLPTLLNILAKGECFPLDPASYTTLFNAFVNSLGIPTRILEGYTLSLYNGDLIPHIWPEIFLASCGLWLPFETYHIRPGAVITYPTDETIYLLEGKILPLPDSRTKVKVSTY